MNYDINYQNFNFCIFKNILGSNVFKLKVNVKNLKYYLGTRLLSNMIAIAAWTLERLRRRNHLTNLRF